MNTFSLEVEIEGETSISLKFVLLLARTHKRERIGCLVTVVDDYQAVIRQFTSVFYVFM
jgi:hypothetical protein